MTAGNTSPITASNEPITDVDSRISQHVTPERLARLSSRVLVGSERPHLEVANAMTGETLGAAPRSNAVDVVKAAARARVVQQRWAQWPVRQRSEVFLRLHDLVLDRQEEVLDLIQLENGKARRHAFEEVMDVALTSRYYANTVAELLRPRRRQGALPVLTSTVELAHPKGLVGIISPWNYPLTLGISDAIPALLAGNAVLLKPDAQTPYSALWAVELLEEAGLPPGLVQVVTGSGSELGAPIIENSDYLMFTGSTAVGRTVAAATGERLIDSSMELGGKNALIVLDDAHLGRAVAGALRACFSNSGQLCISTERIYVLESVYEEFVRRFVTAVRQMRLSAALDHSGDMGSLISGKQLETVTRHVEDARDKGATVLAGGRPRPDIGPNFYEPTVLTDVTESMEVYAAETFGPVVSVYKVAGEDEAVSRANDSDYGLSFSLWTRNRQRGREVATRLQAGSVNINDAYGAAWGSIDAPMGGMKSSGLGRRHGAAGLLKYTESQTVAEQRLLPVGVPSGVDPDVYARAMSMGLKVLKRLPWVK